MDASHTNPLGAYAAINTLRLDDLRPHILRTRDGGKTWTEIVTGIPAGETVNSVKEDPKRKGLLFAGTERTVYFSIDDGDHWQSLRLNLPVTSIRDLVVKDDDLVIGTHGRGFWILDDITPLRQIDAKTTAAPAVLFKPQRALRVRWNMNTDTPLPQEEPAGQNPPDGAIINYVLTERASGPVTLEVLDAAGKVVRVFSSGDPVEPIKDEGNVPAYWIRPARLPSAEPGMHRFVWDLHYARPAGMRTSFPIAAVYGNTAREPNGVWALPGTYTVRLTVNGQSYTQPLTVAMDPRVKTLPAALLRQFTLSKQLADAMDEVGKRMGGSGAGAELARVNAALLNAYNLIQAADVAPTTQAVKAAQQALAAHSSSLPAR
jgi:hypothetical protein